MNHRQIDTGELVSTWAPVPPTVGAPATWGDQMDNYIVFVQKEDNPSWFHSLQWLLETIMRTGLKLQELQIWCYWMLSLIRTWIYHQKNGKMLGGIPLEVFSLVDFRASRISLSRLVAAAASSVFRCKTCIAPRWLRSQFRATPELDDRDPIEKFSTRMQQVFCNNLQRQR